VKRRRGIKRRFHRVSWQFSGLCSNEFAEVHALAQAVVLQSARVRRAVSLHVCTLAPAFVLASLLTACAVGPEYSPAPAPVPIEFKELKGYKRATPRDDVDRGDWWSAYRDPKLAELLRQVEISNQTVAASAAAYEEARAIIREAQSSLLPVATAGYSVTRTRTGARAGSTGGGAVGANLGTRYTTQYSSPINGSWDLDVWGKVRRQIESDTAAAQASAADLDNAKLSAQAQLATAYFNLRATDSLRDLFMRTVALDKRTLGIVQNQFNAGYSVTAGDVATAQAQLDSAQAQLIDTGVQRAQFEHAIAMLTGRPPAELNIGPHLLAGGIPRIPATIPSALLERRPDIAAAERIMQQQNALIGVAEANYFPDISLSAAVQFLGPIPLPFSAARSIQSIGASATQTLFNGGLTAAQVDAARAVYWQSVANYRQTVLVAFQQVEDELAAIHRYSAALGVQQRAVQNQQKAVDVFLNQFQQGLVAFTTVVQAELTLLNDQESELTIRQNLFVASVSLIEALGGGWDTTLLPTQPQLQKDFSLLPQLESTTQFGGNDDGTVAPQPADVPLGTKP
jgi:NodT family efflux transporter outer membrane factor (OMF) lipoprotein